MKKQNFFLLTFLMLLIISTSGYSQSLHTVELSNFQFSPDNLTIEVGDTVRWSNVEGTHNVLADDNSFTSGPAAPAPWTFEHVFTATGNNPYYCEPHGGAGGSGMSGVIIVELPVSVADDGSIVNKFELNQNYPNPFNPTTTIKYSIPANGIITLRVFNAIGEEVSMLANEIKEAGTYDVSFNAAQLSSGIYFYRLQAGSFVETKKMILLK
jgi:plastocyanin